MLASTGAKINIMPDWTVFVQLGVFLLTLLVLNFLVFRPVLRVLDRRRSFTEDARNDAAEKNLESEKLEKEREAAITEAYKEAEVMREAKIAAKRREAEAIVADAKTRMQGLLDSTEVSVETSESAAASEISRRAEELAKGIVSRVAGDRGRE
ncbi:MAG TPA: ATP synthase F0 subunit B [bacterium]|nr:ATP synthase F0 subunit B [bacterium]